MPISSGFNGAKWTMAPQTACGMFFFNVNNVHFSCDWWSYRREGGKVRDGSGPHTEFLDQPLFATWRVNKYVTTLSVTHCRCSPGHSVSIYFGIKLLITKSSKTGILGRQFPSSVNSMRNNPLGSQISKGNISLSLSPTTDPGTDDNRDPYAGLVQHRRLKWHKIFNLQTFPGQLDSAGWRNT